MDAPKLPKPKLHRATWDGRPGWMQYHDETDPLPTTWDDEPPDVTEGFFDGEQMRQCAQAQRERCASKLLALKPDAIRLALGEMTAQEMRSVLAVLKWQSAVIRGTDPA